MNHKPARGFSPVDILGATVCAGLTAVFVFAILWPMLANRHSAQAREAALATERAKAGQLASQVAGAKTELDSVRKAITSNPLALESEDRLNNRVAGITSFSKKCGVEIQDISPGSPVRGPQYDSVTIHFTGRGSHRNCVAFFHQLHETYLDTAIRSFRITSNPLEPSGPLSIDFDLVWFAKAGTTARAD